MISKQKTCLVVLPSINYTFDNTLNGIKINVLQEIKYYFEKENIQWKIATYLGNKPIVNFDNEEKNRNWLKDNISSELISNVLNFDNVTVNNYEGLFIPSFISIYEEVKINDNTLTRLIYQFHNQNKPICVIGHSVFALCRVVDENNIWPFICYNFTGISIFKFMMDSLFNNKYLDIIIEELVLLQGGNFMSSDSQVDDIVVVADRNIITGMDHFSNASCLVNLTAKMNM